jgi:hypothetical protein
MWRHFTHVSHCFPPLDCDVAPTALHSTVCALTTFTDLPFALSLCFGLSVTTHAAQIDAVNVELERQLSTLSTADTARVAVTKGYAVLAPTMASAIDVCDRVAPEHLEVAMHP